MLILGNRKVALFNGCFCLALSLTPAVLSGNDTDLTTGDPAGRPLAPVGVDDGAVLLGWEVAATNLDKPNPNFPEIALSVPPTLGPTGAAGELGPAPGVSSSSNSDFAPPPTTVTMSRRRFERVGLAGGGGGLRIPFVGGLGRRGAGELGLIVLSGPACAGGFEEVSVLGSSDFDEGAGAV